MFDGEDRSSRMIHVQAVNRWEVEAYQHGNCPGFSGLYTASDMA